MLYTGWIGFLLVFVCCFVSAYTGDILGKCWTLTQERRPELRQGSVRYPYPAIGEEAYGKVGRFVLSRKKAMDWKKTWSSSIFLCSVCQ